MREIKFRAWLPKPNGDETMRYQVSISNKLIDDLDAFFKVTSHDGIVWMQYIGLKDKNGKEIYEGDVVKFNSEEYGTFISGYVWEISWSEIEARYFMSHGQREQYECKEFDFTFSDTCEIIGNIYENPELLKK